MKTKLFIIVIIFTLNICNIFAQFKLTSDGNVRIGGGIANPGARLEVQENGNLAEARIFATSPNVARIWTSNSVYGYALGIDASGIGHIYKNMNSPYAIMNFNSNGVVGINYTLSYSQSSSPYVFYVGGSALTYYGNWVNSDIRFKKNISKISNSLNLVNKLEGKKYSYINEPIKQNNANNEHYGLIAQDVKKIFPELVQENNDSLKSLAINYEGFIPILIEALKEQNKLIDSLATKILFMEASLSGGADKKNATIDNVSNITKDNHQNKAVLNQNIPNPFDKETIISFYIPESVFNASILIFNLQGNQIMSIPIQEKGKSSVTIKGSILNPGMYLYSLIADNIEVDTKRMILSK